MRSRNKINDMHESEYIKDKWRTLCAENLLVRPRESNPVISLLAIAYCIMLNLGARRMLVRESARRTVEALFPEFFG
jgi:hypothetical protein